MRTWILIALLLLSSDAYALTVCKCTEKQSVEEEFQRAFAVFTGTVEDIKIGIGANKRTKVTFKVHRSWKGATHETISVYAAGSGLYSRGKELLLCNYQFTEGQTYLVFSHRKHNRNGLSFVSECGNTTNYKYATNIINELGVAMLEPSKEPYIPEVVYKDEERQLHLGGNGQEQHDAVE